MKDIATFFNTANAWVDGVYNMHETLKVYYIDANYIYMKQSESGFTKIFFIFIVAYSNEQFLQ